MKKYLTLLCLLVIGLSSCQKVYTSKLKVTQAEIDDQKIQDYIAANNITGAVKDPTGIYYKILIPGTTPNPVSNSIVKVTYALTFLNGVTIGNVEGQTAQLTTFIRGVQIALPKMGTGGRMLLLVPSGLAYGAVGSSNIPENSILNYTLDLNGIAN
ncbi:FKBP-type peptidyl-prolyl cis-trans isomerase [Mucilaginibacter antarcticus]|uniref:Peptidyl-prolyl cis-trans isomerase n=1 Tax=Mucilaginibacter antarcticus TaxID=1855725 RepID=A0ABW5XLL4_9SPHI